MLYQKSNKEQTLLEQLAAGDENAFRTLFDSYRNRLFYYIFRFIKSEQVAEELVMDVFVKIWLGRELVAQINNFDAFLFRVAHNKSIDFLRSAATDPRMKELLLEQIHIASTEQADSPVLVREYEEVIREAIGLLSPLRKNIYTLSREQDLTHDQIARRLNISKSTVNNNLVEAQKFIRNYLSRSLDLSIIIFLLEKI